MTVFLVGAGPGDPGLLTRRGAELLAAADVVVFDRLVSPALLELAPANAIRIDVGKRPGQLHRQDDINSTLVEHGRAGRSVVRLKGGDPFLFGRGGEEAEALVAAGVEFEIVPGVPSALAAPAYAGIPVTHRGLSTSVTIVTGHVGSASLPGGVDWESLARAGGTLVILMGMAHRAEIAERLLAGGRRPDTPVAVVHWGTTAEQRTVRTTLASLAAVELGPPSTIVVGATAALELSWFERRPLLGVTVLVTRAASQAAGLVERLGSAGASVVALPVIEVVEAADGGTGLRLAADEVRAYQWVVLTSANAVERFVPLLRDGRSLGSTRLAVVGPATADVLARFHLVADLVASGGSAEDLVAEMPAAAGGGKVLYPRAAQAREVVARGLRAKGWVVDEVEAYRTVAAVPVAGSTAEAIDAAMGADVVTFTSPSTVTHFLALAAGAHRPPPRVVACLGPVTADAAARAGLSVDVVADERSEQGLVDALAKFLAARARP